MNTDELIAQLAGEPVPSRSVAETLGRGLAAGSVVSIALMLVWLHPRPDYPGSLMTAAFWMKLGYAAALAALAFPVAAQLSRPAGKVGNFALLLLMPVLALAAIAAFQLYVAVPSQRMHLVMGGSSNNCSFRIIALSMPILAGAFLGLRRLAPTRLAMAGMAAGLLAGAVGTVIYALHCNESAAPFVVIFYSLGMAGAGLIGGILGRFLLRW